MISQLVDKLSDEVAYMSETEMLNTVANLIQEINLKRAEVNREAGIRASLSKMMVFNKKTFEQSRRTGKEVTIKNDYTD